MNQPQKKRRFSFSLRTLMVFMLALCLLFGLVGMRLQWAREQQAFLREINASGSWGSHNDQDGLVMSGGFVPNLWELLTDSYFERINAISYDGDFYDVDNGEDELDLELLVVKLKNLKLLDFINTQVSDFTPLTNLKNLQLLNISNSQVSDLSPLAKLKNLQWLYISETQVTNLAPLAGLKNLRLLKIDNTQVSDLTPLAGLKNLCVLELKNTQVSDLTPLEKLKNLELLILDNTQVSDLDPLAELENLRSLYVCNTKVSYEKFQQLRDALPNCHIRSDW